MKHSAFILFSMVFPSLGLLLGQEGCPEDDLDQDGYSQEEGDCNDTDPNIHPGQVESCDDVDNDCDGNVDNIYAWYVDASQEGSADGLTWQSAFKTLEDAIGAAKECPGPVWVAAGIYRAAAPSSPVLDMAFGIEIYGGFEGSETTLEARAGLFEETVLSGDYDLSGSLSEPDSPRVVIGQYGARLDGFLIEGGYARDEGIQVQTTGAGMYNLLVTDLVVANVIFRGNYADFAAGALWNEDSEILFESVRFENNSAGEYGGAVLNYRSRTSFSDCLWSQNTARLGGAIYHESNDVLTIESSSFHQNEATDGGAVLADGDLVLSNVDFIENHADPNYGSGGAVYLSPGWTAELVNLSALDNSAWSGDVLFLDGSVGDVFNTVVWFDESLGGQPFVAYTEDSILTLAYTASPLVLEGDAMLELDSDPFVRFDLDGDGGNELLLAEDSPCRDAGSNELAWSAGGLSDGWWRTMTTSENCVLDADPIDMGRHYPSCEGF